VDVSTSGRKNFGVQAPFAGRMPYFTVIRPVTTVHNIVHIIVLPPASKNLLSTRCRLTKKKHRTMRSYATLIISTHYATQCDYMHMSGSQPAATKTRQSRSWLTGCCDHGRCSCILARGCVAVCLSDNGRTPAIRQSDIPYRIPDVCLCPRSKIWTYWLLNTFCGCKYGRLGVIQNPAYFTVI